MAGPTILIKKRLIVLLVSFTLLVFSLVIRVGWIQIVKGAEYQKLAYDQQTRALQIPSKRGTIYDRNGKVLAISASAEQVTVFPAQITDPEKSAKENELAQVKVAQGLAQILGMNEEDVLSKVRRKVMAVLIKGKIEKEIGDQVRQWTLDNKIKGVMVEEDTKRYYPNRNLASHVLGFTGIDNQGLGGIEYVMDEYLKGVPGKILSEADAKGRSVPFEEEKYIAPQDGLDLVLTIDESIQYFAQKVIEKAMDDNHVLNGAAAIVMDPRNGDVLAMVSKPDFDCNDPRGVPKGIDLSAWSSMSNGEKLKILNEVIWRNKTVQDTYEPGSTFKAITSAAGLEEGVIAPDSPVNDRTISLGGWQIKCWRPNFHGEETFTEGVYNSCNPVFVRVAQSLGIDRFYKYVRSFGFYDKTGIELTGEAKSIIHPNPTEINMATASFGQTFQITPIQLITAYGAIANGGNLIKPHLVKELRDSDGNIVKKYEPEVVRNVISAQTSDTLKEILEGVVSKGTGKNAYVTGYRVAGKTGTSETLESESKGRYIASFMAFAPADNPVICALVILDHPDVYPHTGGMIAAPVAKELVEDVLDYLEVERRYSEMDKELMLQEVYVPDIRKMTTEEAKKALKERGLECKIENNGDTSKKVVIDQTPKPGASIPQGSVIVLYTYEPEEQIMVKVPNLLNKTISEATEALAIVGLNIKVDGLGTVTQQSIEPGTEVEKGEIVQVVFKTLNTE